MRTRNWPTGYRTGFCLTGSHNLCKNGVWNPATQTYLYCACKECDHPVQFQEDADEEFFGEEDEMDPFVFEPGERPAVFGGAVILDDEEEEEEFFGVDEEEEEEEFF